MNALLQQLLALGRRNPVTALSVATLVLLGIANYFLWQRYSEIAAHHEHTRADGEAVLLALTGHNRIETQLATVQEALGYIDQNLFVETDLAGNLDYFYQIEKAARVRLSDLSQLSSQPVEADSAYKTIPFSLRMSGQYYQLVNFLHQLETGPRLVKVKSYGFTRRDPATDSLGLDLTLEALARP